MPMSLNDNQHVIITSRVQYLHTHFGGTQQLSNWIYDQFNKRKIYPAAGNPANYPLLVKSWILEESYNFVKPS